MTVKESSVMITQWRLPLLPTHLLNLSSQILDLCQHLWRRADAHDRLPLLKLFKSAFLACDDELRILWYILRLGLRRFGAWNWRGLRCFEGIEQLGELALEGVVVFPEDEVGNV